jgi:dynein heavy chain
MIGEIHYGGRITRTNDRRTIEAITENIFSSTLETKGALLCPELSKFAVTVEPTDVVGWRAAVVAQFSANEPPTAFGLSANAELSHRTVQAQRALSLLLTVQSQLPGASSPTSSSSAPTTARDGSLQAILSQITKKMPTAPLERKPPIPAGGGHAGRQLQERLDPLRPMAILFAHEMAAVNRVVVRLCDCVARLGLALSGSIVMTHDLHEFAQALSVSHVAPSLTAISWTALSFSQWLNMLLRRYEQVKAFFAAGERPCYDIGAFFNPRGLLSVVRQEICRKRAVQDGAQLWPLERVESKFTVTRLKTSDVERSPEEGVFIGGLLLDGASWDVAKGRLRPPLPLELFHELPVVLVSASVVSSGPSGSQAPSTKQAGGAGSSNLNSNNANNETALLSVELAASSGFVSQQQFRNFRGARGDGEQATKKVRLPCFTSPRRGEEHFLSTIELLHDESVSTAWIIRGVALLTSTE